MDDPLKLVLDIMDRYQVNQADRTQVMVALLEDSRAAFERGREKVLNELRQIHSEYYKNNQWMRTGTISSAIYRIERMK